ncbi:hypothetical protein JYB85_17940 [Shewanella sedimentimangrovi]|uniref:Fibronectin type-III domain-containing protein n=2 Tax=Shewanella sedimentimangrovi TaxID=2814293 RepID=A0ABX7R5P7_9GAMM|nr:hypothetical protein JYB85_17940 [Shewanella sedimentimangrovi]
MGCDVTAVNIQESLNGSSWSTVYTGLGNANDGSMLMATTPSPTNTTEPASPGINANGNGVPVSGMPDTAQGNPQSPSSQPTSQANNLAIGGSCSGWTAARFIGLSNRTQAGYYYRINACNSSACSAYSGNLLLGSEPAPAVPGSITVPASSSAGQFNVTWSTVSGATRYELQQRFNGGAWTAKYSGSAANFSVSGLMSGSYQYQVRACNSSCSGWKVSSSVTVTVSANDWKNFSQVSVTDASGSDVEPSDSIDLSAATIKGQAGVSGGQASYHIPIDVPPGRNGAQPSISLSYNSQGGNGLLGVGWSINAGSAISRCGANYAQDGLTRAVTFNATNDKLCLDGQKLKVVSGSYGLNNAHYRTEMDSLVDVLQVGNLNDATSSFIVRRLNGVTATYGAVPNSRFSLAGLTTVLSWKVTQERYLNEKNTVDYEYDSSVAGEHLLSTIYYTGSDGVHGDRSVNFGYESRPDISKQFQAGGYSVTTRRLKSIEVELQGVGSLLQYILNYKNSSASNRSLITSVDQCDGQSLACSQSTSLTWLDDKQTISTSELMIGGQKVYAGETDIDKITPHGDINGDGATDFPGYFTNAEQGLVAENSFTHEKACYFDYVSDGWICPTFDADNDGKIDLFKSINNILHIQYSGSGSTSYIPTGIPFNPNRFPSPDRIMGASDFNGDGYVDLMVFTVVDSVGYWRAYLNTKTTTPFSGYQVIHSSPIDAAYGSWPKRPKVDVNIAGDLDGNGMVDFVISNLGGSGAANAPVPRILSFVLNNSIPQQWSVQWKSAPDYRFDIGGGFHFFQKLVDINGDGLPDMISWRMVGPDRKIGYELNQGNAVFADWVEFGGNVSLAERSHSVVVTAGEPLDVIYPKHFDSMQLADIDLDGVDEILLPGTRFITGCAYVMFPGGTSGSGIKKTLCGDALYGDMPVDSFNTVPSKPIATSDFDDSIYQYDAIKFVLQSNGIWALQKEATNYYGSAYEVRLMDIFGDGLLDMLTTYGPRIPEAGQYNQTWIQNPPAQFPYGAYISRNYGSGKGTTTADYQPVDYLESVNDGFGNVSHWNYRPLSTGEQSGIAIAQYCEPQETHSANPFYCIDRDKVKDSYVHFASSMYVVKSFFQNNGQGGDNETQYAYKGAMYDLQGRGFTGFNEIWEKDIQRDKTIHSTFTQKFPEIGQLTKQDISVGSQTILQLNNTWQDNNAHAASAVRNKGVFLNQLKKSVQTHLDLNGVKMSVNESTADTVDQYGNVGQRTQKITDYIDGSIGQEGEPNTYTTVIVTDFVADEATWWLNKPNSIRTNTALAGRGWTHDPVVGDKAQWQLQTINDWDLAHRKPKKTTYSASNTACTRIEEAQYNLYGLPNWIKTTGQNNSCSNLTARLTSFIYTKDGINPSGDGYLPYKVTNAKGHVTTTEYDMTLGLPTKVTDPNDFITTTAYDPIGRPVEVSQTGKPTRYIRYLLAEMGSNAPSMDNIAVLLTRTTGAGMPTTEVYFDAQGRQLRSAVEGFDGSLLYQDKEYDALGRQTADSQQYEAGDSHSSTEFGDFDALDRPQFRMLPNGSSGLRSDYVYEGLTTKITVGGRSMSRTYGSQGWLYETVDADGGTNRFAYDAAGRALVIQDANGKKIAASYNGFGFKTQVNDPNQGITTFGYNSLGELDKQTDANGVVQSYSLDVLGRVTQKVTSGGNAPGTASYTWDTLKKGLLSSESENGVTRAYGYTTALQLSQTSVTVDGVTRTVKHQYDGFYGRPKGLEYPNGLTLKYGYNDFGYLETVSNAASGYVYRHVSAMDATGHITGAELGNGIITEARGYSSEGNMRLAEAFSPMGQIHGHYYDAYDDFMNLRSERDAITGLERRYDYDNLNRLQHYSFWTNAQDHADINYAYDKVGNLLKKTDFSLNKTNAYQYGGAAVCAAGSNAGPNAVCQIEKLNNTAVKFTYDKRGNMLTGDGLTMTYDALDKPLNIVGGRGGAAAANTRFVYGSDGMRAKQSRTISGTTTTTYYVDKYYEIDNDGSWRAYLDDIAVLSYTPQRQHLLHFTLRDRLGSATTMADQNGNPISHRYFDPFGRTADVGNSHRLDILNRNTNLSRLADLDITNRNRRGFTDHEHLNEQQLIHMNGRVYDYNLGRFMSVDPLIQSPTSTQSINPYSYIMNNPLAGTDPTGYAACSETGSHLKGQSGVFCSAIDYGSGSGLKKKETKPEPVSNGAPQIIDEAPANLDLSQINGPSGKLQYIQVVKRDSSGNIVRDDKGRIVDAGLDGLSKEEIDFLTKLDALVIDYKQSISNMRNQEATDDFNNTDWFYDPQNPEVQGEVVARARNVRDGESTPYGNMSRNLVVFGRRGINIMNRSVDQGWKYHGQNFHGGKAGMLEVVAHEAGHTIENNFWELPLPGKAPTTQLPIPVLEDRANSHMRGIKMDNHFPEWYYNSIY